MAAKFTRINADVPVHPVQVDVRLSVFNSMLIIMILIFRFWSTRVKMDN